MIQIEGLSRFYGNQDVFRDCDLHIGPSDRIGLVGPNGAGKTTLLRLILGEEQPNAGAIFKPKDLKIGYLPQSFINLKGKTVLGLLLEAKGDLRSVQEELDETTRYLEGASEEGEISRLTERQGHLQQVFDHLGGYELEARAKAILLGLGFKGDHLHRPIETFSGGWTMRAAMARILLSDPNLVLLDEPTNHLDLESLVWMEDYLQNSPSALLLVSHDRVFLNNVVDRIVEIDRGRLISYTGNYSFYEREKAKRIEMEQAAYESQQERIRQIERFIERNRVRKDRAKQVQSRIKMLEKMERMEPPVLQQTVDFEFPPTPRAPKVLIELKNVSKSYDSQWVYDGISLSLQRGDRMALLGPNGAGKTTLMRILRGEVDFEGDRRRAAGVRVGVFSQEQMDQLDSRRTVLDELQTVAGDLSRGRLRNMLAVFLFKGDDVFKRVSVLSGGEKSRLLLCKILVQPTNLLLLDEPTNHLDIPSREVLEQALCRYGGTIGLVTHDRHLINAVANRVLLIQDRKVETFPGNFDDFQSIWSKRVARSSVIRDGPLEREGEGSKKKNRDQKRAEAEWREGFYREVNPLRERLIELEERIEKGTVEMEEITRELAKEETCRNPQRLRELSEAYRRLKLQVAGWTGKWEVTALEIEEVEQRFEELKPGLDPDPEA
jgi:ATP-binding cassette subfamily F protein 3